MIANTMIPATPRPSRSSRSRAPRQARSEATYRRLLDAAETLLTEASFDQVTVARIAARAGVTIGAFYARFADKDALLEALEERVTEAVLAVVNRAIDPARWEGATIEEAIRHYLAELIATYRETRGAGRALVLQAHTDPALRRRLHRLNVDGPPQVLELLRRHATIHHPAPKLGLEVGFLAVRSLLREILLFGETFPGGSALSDRALAEELTRLLLRYLGVRADARLRFAGGPKGR